MGKDKYSICFRCEERKVLLNLILEGEKWVGYCEHCLLKDRRLRETLHSIEVIPMIIKKIREKNLQDNAKYKKLYKKYFKVKVV